MNLRIVVALALTCSSAALSGQNPVKATTAGLTLDSEPLRLGAGDLLDLAVFDTPELSATRVRINQDGTLKLSVGGDVKVAGLTAREASVVVENRLRSYQIMIDPHVSILVTEYATQGIRVLGQVRNPGSYVLLGNHSLYDAFAAAGGVNPQAGDVVTITHQDDPTHPTRVLLNSPNYSEEDRLTAVRPGDTIFVSRAAAVFVFGDVTRPGQLLIDNGQPLTVLQAVALSLGTARAAAVSHVAVLRQTASGPIRIPLNLKRIERNQDVNMALQPADILVVPHSNLKQFIDSTLPTATGAVIGASVAAAVDR